MKNQIFENFEYRLTTAFANNRCSVEVSYLWNGRPTKRLIHFYKEDKADYIKEAKKIIQNEIDNGRLLKHSKRYHRFHIGAKPFLVTLLCLSFVAAVTCATIFTYQYLSGGTSGGGGSLPPGTEIEVKPDVIDPSGGKYEVSLGETSAKVGEKYTTTIDLKRKNADTTYILPNELRKVTSNTTELTRAQYTYNLNASKTSANFEIEGQYVYGPISISLILVAPEVETIKLSFKGNDCTASVANANEDTWDWEKKVEKGKPVTINIQTADSYHLGSFKQSVTITNRDAAGEFTYTGFGDKNKTGSITFTAPVGDFGVTVNAIKDISDVTITLKDELKSDFILRDSDNQQVDTIYIGDTNNDYTCYLESVDTRIADNLAINIDDQPVTDGWAYDSLSHALTLNKELIATPCEIVITDAQSMYSVTFVDDYGVGLTINGVNVSDTFVTFDDDDNKVDIKFDQEQFIDIQSIYVGDIPIQYDDTGHQYSYNFPEEGLLSIYSNDNSPIANDIRVVFNSYSEGEDRITLVYDRRSAPKDEKNIDGVAFVLYLTSGDLPWVTIDWGDGSSPQEYYGLFTSVMHDFTKRERSIITITAKEDTKIVGLELVNYLTTSEYEYDTDIYAEYITAGNAYITAATVDASELEFMQFADCNLNTYEDTLETSRQAQEAVENIIHMVEPSHSHLERITFSYNTKYIPFGCCFNCPMLKEVNVSGLVTSDLFDDYSEDGLQNAITAEYIDSLAFANTFKENTGKLNRLSLIDVGLIKTGTKGSQSKCPYAFANCPYVTLINYDYDNGDYSDDYSDYMAYVAAEATDVITPSLSIPPIYNPYRNLIYRSDDGHYDVLYIEGLFIEEAFLIRYTGKNVNELVIPSAVSIKGSELTVRGFGGPNFFNPIMKKTVQKVSAKSTVAQILSGTFDGASSLSTFNSDLADFVGARAFRGTALEEVALSVSNVSVEAETFADCLKLKSVNFENAVALNSIGCLAFNNCPLLAASEDSDPIVIPGYVQYIMGGAFGGNNIAKGKLQMSGGYNYGYFVYQDTILYRDGNTVAIIAATPYSNFSQINYVISVYCGAAYNITFADECSDVVLHNDSYITSIQLFAFKGAHMHSFEAANQQTNLVILSNAFEDVTLDETEGDNRTLTLPYQTQICSYAFANSDFDTIDFYDVGEVISIIFFDYAFINSNITVIDLTGVIDAYDMPNDIVARTYSINKEARIKVNNIDQARELMSVAYLYGHGWPIDINRYIIE